MFNLTLYNIYLKYPMILNKNAKHIVFNLIKIIEHFAKKKKRNKYYLVNIILTTRHINLNF